MSHCRPKRHADSVQIVLSLGRWICWLNLGWPCYVSFVLDGGGTVRCDGEVDQLPPIYLDSIYLYTPLYTWLEGRIKVPTIENIPSFIRSIFTWRRFIRNRALTTTSLGGQILQLKLFKPVRIVTPVNLQLPDRSRHPPPSPHRCCRLAIT